MDLSERDSAVVLVPRNQCSSVPSQDEPEPSAVPRKGKERVCPLMSALGVPFRKARGFGTNSDVLIVIRVTVR